ncbi:hypothetical protein EJ07DRAFT_179696 [Lizonia empirigonia]|nr:hypothetical protein EJ07DRAFT_179696 [Lizonia empirigonia]
MTDIHARTSSEVTNGATLTPFCANFLTDENTASAGSHSFSPDDLSSSTSMSDPSMSREHITDWDLGEVGYAYTPMYHHRDHFFDTEDFSWQEVLQAIEDYDWSPNGQESEDNLTNNNANHPEEKSMIIPALPTHLSPADSAPENVTSTRHETETTEHPDTFQADGLHSSNAISSEEKIESEYAHPPVTGPAPDVPDAAASVVKSLQRKAAPEERESPNFTTSALEAIDQTANASHNDDEQRLLQLSAWLDDGDEPENRGGDTAADITQTGPYTYGPPSAAWVSPRVQGPVSETHAKHVVETEPEDLTRPLDETVVLAEETPLPSSEMEVSQHQSIYNDAVDASPSSDVERCDVASATDTVATSVAEYAGLPEEMDIDEEIAQSPDSEDAFHHVTLPTLPVAEKSAWTHVIDALTTLDYTTPTMSSTEEAFKPNATHGPDDATSETYDGTHGPDEAFHGPDDATHKPDDATHKPDNAIHGPDDATRKDDASTHESKDVTCEPDDAIHGPSDTAHGPGDATSEPDNGIHSPDGAILGTGDSAHEPKDGTPDDGIQEPNGATYSPDDATHELDDSTDEPNNTHKPGDGTYKLNDGPPDDRTDLNLPLSPCPTSIITHQAIDATHGLDYAIHETEDATHEPNDGTPDNGIQEQDNATNSPEDSTHELKDDTHEPSDGTHEPHDSQPDNQPKQPPSLCQTPTTLSPHPAIATILPSTSIPFRPQIASPPTHCIPTPLSAQHTPTPPLSPTTALCSAMEGLTLSLTPIPSPAFPLETRKRAPPSPHDEMERDSGPARKKAKLTPGAGEEGFCTTPPASGDDGGEFTAGDECGDLSARDEADMDCEYADGDELCEYSYDDVCVAAQGRGAGHMIESVEGAEVGALLEGAAREEDGDDGGGAQQVCVEEEEEEEEEEAEEEEEGKGECAQQTCNDDNDVKIGTSLFSGPYIQHNNNADMREQIHTASASASPASPSPSAEAETPASRTSPSPASNAQLHAPSIAHQAPRHQPAIQSPSAPEPTNLKAIKLESNTNIDALLNELLPHHPRHHHPAPTTILSNPFSSSANLHAHTGIKPTKHSTSKPEDLNPQPATPPHAPNRPSSSLDRQSTIQKRHPTPLLLRELSLPYGRRTTRSETAGQETGSEEGRSVEVGRACGDEGLVVGEGVKKENEGVVVGEGAKKENKGVDVKRECAQRKSMAENDGIGVAEIEGVHATETKSVGVKKQTAMRQTNNLAHNKQSAQHVKHTHHIHLIQPTHPKTSLHHPIQTPSSNQASD